MNPLVSFAKQSPVRTGPRWFARLCLSQTLRLWPLVAGSFEALAALLLIQDQPIASLATHGAAAGITAISVAIRLRSRPLPFRLRGVLVAATVALGLPFLGMWGIWLVVLPAMTRRPAEKSDKLRILPMQHFAGATQTVGPVSELSSALLRGHPAQRIAALKSLRRMAPRETLPAIRHALNDPDEDVRLLAFAIVEQRERSLRAQLEQLEQQLAAAPPNAVGQYNLRIAELHFELVHAGFASGDASRAELEKVCSHARQACQEHYQGAANTLLGRALLGLQRWEEAQQALVSAGHSGVSQATWRPLLAEALFAQGNYSQLQTTLAGIPKLAGKKPMLASLARHWTPQ